MIEIDVQNILHNVRVLRAMLGGTRLCCVVKGDGYGCGDVRLSRVLERYAHVDMIAVAILDEAVHLRESGITLPILVLCDIANEDAEKVLEYNLIPSLYRWEFARRLNQVVPEGKRVPVHVRLDVCAGSPGMEPSAFMQMLPALETLPRVRLDGLYTQLYGAYVENRGSLDRQLAAFKAVVDSLPAGLRGRMCIHAASTAAACACPDTHFDMVRVGAALYGLPHDDQPSPFLPVMSIRSRIISLKTVSGAVFTGYHEEEQRGGGPRRLATVLGGYEDALFLMFVRRGYMLVHGRRAPIVGEACMDTTTIDVTGIPEAQLDDEVVLLGRQGDEEITIADIMRDSGFTMANCQLVFKTGRRTQKKYVHYPKAEQWRPLLEQVTDRSPTIREAVKAAQGGTLAEYVDRMADFQPGPPLSDPEDAPRAVEQLLTPLLGAAAAHSAAAGLDACALTANHHGVDCFAQSVQGNLLYQRLLETRGVRPESVPVLACGSIPLDNSSYGKGLLLFDTLDGNYPLRVPVIPNGYNKSIVGFFPAMTREMVDRALRRLDEDDLGGRLSPAMREAARHVLRDCYGDARTLAMDRYAQQASAINLRMTREAVGAGFAYVELERVATALLLLDFADPSSLAARLLADASLRRAVYEALDGVTGCWQKDALRRGTAGAGGTMLFWAVGARWTRAPMADEEGALVNLKTGERLPYAAVPDALRAGRIYPALLMCFLPLLFARGIRCFGGCFQPAYLRAMRDGLAAALRRVGDGAQAQVLEARDPAGYLSGPMFLEGANGAPVGIVELLARKRPHQEIRDAMKIEFVQAHRIALTSLYPDIVPAADRVPDYAGLLRKVD